MINRRRLIIGGISAACAANSIISPGRAHLNLFERLWQNHPLGNTKGEGIRHPCDLMRKRSCTYNGTDIEDQCAVRMGVTFARTFGSETFRTFPRIKRETLVMGTPRTCLHLGGGREKCAWHDASSCHFINAYELRLALDAISTSNGDVANLFGGIGKAIVMKTRHDMMNFRKTLAGHNGIIYFHRYWGAGNAEVGGGHIDLWGGARQEVKLEIFKGEREARFSKRAKAIWFWPVT